MGKLKTNNKKVKPPERSETDKESGTVLTWLKNHIFTIFLTIFSLCSVVVATLAYFHSEKALKKTEEMFLLENRPYLLISSQPFVDNQTYYSAEVKQKDKGVAVHFQFKIENIGKLAATDIVFSGQMALTNKISGTVTLSPQNPKQISVSLLNPFMAPDEFNKFTLAPGESEYIGIIVPFTNVPTRYAKGFVETFDTMVQESGLGVKIIAEYKNEIDKATVIRISKTYKIFKKRAYMVGSTEPQ
jgi:hypothetical protein